MGLSSKLIFVYVICHRSHLLPVFVLRFGQSPLYLSLVLWSMLQKLYHIHVLVHVKYYYSTSVRSDSLVTCTIHVVQRYSI